MTRRREAASVSNWLLILKSVLVKIGVHPAISNAKYTLRNCQAMTNLSQCVLVLGKGFNIVHTI